jgi:hypothetical protein
VRTFLFALVVGIFAYCSPAQAVDYARIDRSFTKEPAYQSKSPQYALFLFGSEAKLRVWFVLDGLTVYVDRNGDGDLTAKDERFAKLEDCKNVTLAEPDGKTRYLISSIGSYKDEKLERQHVMVNVEITGPIAYKQYCDVELVGSAREARIAHFHGPLSIGPRTILWKVPPELALKTGENPTDLNAVIGTMDARHGCWVVVCTHLDNKSAFPTGVVPVVDIQFPSRQAGGNPVKKRYALDKFC